MSNGANICDVCGHGPPPKSWVGVWRAARALQDACRVFVGKCERGEARSVHSYGQMKKALQLAEDAWL